MTIKKVKTPKTAITLLIPDDLVVRIDAVDEDMSRSWVVIKALKQYFKKADAVDEDGF